jgi:hypothetical protein
MLTALFTDEVRDTLRFVVAVHIHEVYDDPSIIDYDAKEVRKLEKAAAFLGVDFWDTGQIQEICGSRVVQSSLDRVRKIVAW